MDQSIVIDKVSQNVSSTSVDDLLHFYTDVPPMHIKKSSVSATINLLLGRNNYKQKTEQEYTWLNYTRQVPDSQNEAFNGLHTMPVISNLRVMSSVPLPYSHSFLNLLTQ